MFRKVGVLLAALVALLALTAAVASASSDEGYPEPQTTNIPYVGWLATQLKLSKCFDLGDTVPAGVTADQLALVDGGQRLSLASLAFRGKFTIEAWSGTNTSIVNSPFFVNGANGDRTSQDVVPFIERYRGPETTIFVNEAKETQTVRAGDEGRRLCFSVHLTSYSPGLAVVKLAIREDLLGLFPGQDPELKHQFLAIFLQASEPTLTEEAGGGDPDGSGNYHPIGAPGSRDWQPGFVKTVVKGTFPHGNIGPIFPSGPANITLPDDWATLAGLWAVDDDPYAGGEYGSAPTRWDIHDDTVEQTGPAHQHTSDVCRIPASVYDSVDNCLGTVGTYDSDFGPFSRDNTLHDFSGFEVAFPAIGPFDPLRPNTSFLPNAVLDSGDAPMPALRVDLDTTGTIGQLIKADKSDVYSLDGEGFVTGDTPHNLYAPFYKAYIPAAELSGTSGVSGAEGNNFPGFQTRGSLYDYWDVLLPETYSNPDNTCRNPLGQIYRGSSGVSGITLYTDEHGEAWAMYDPNIDPIRGGFDLIETVADTTNRKCDVAPGVAGVETISARGFYPEQPALGIPYASPLTKTVHHEGSKTLTCAPKTGFDGIICTETITDLAGNPLPGAVVRYSVVSEVGGGAQVLQGEGQVGTLDQKGLTLVSDANGQAKAFISDSFNRCLDIRVENLGTQWLPDGNAPGPPFVDRAPDGRGNDSSVGVTRTVKYTGQTGVVCGAPTTPPPGGGGSSGGGGGSTGGGGSSAGGSSVVVSLGTPPIQAQPVLQVSTTKTAIIASNSARLFSVKVLQTKLGRYLVVNVKGKAKTAKLRIVLVSKNGKALKTITRVVPTNKAFKIANLKLPKTAATVRASVLSA